MPRAKHREFTNVNFSKCKNLVNKQFQYKTLGEMVAMYRLTGEFPAVGMRNGVYFAKDIDSELPPFDEFDAADKARKAMSDIEDLETREQEDAAHRAAAEQDAMKAELEDLRKFKQQQENLIDVK